MNKAQTDIRTTSYDALSARPEGYVGTIEDALAQIRAEPETEHQRPRGRTELRMFLGVPPKHLSVSDGPSLEDDHVEYGPPIESPLVTLLSVVDRLEVLTDAQSMIYGQARATLSIIDALAVAEAYPYPAPRG